MLESPKGCSKFANLMQVTVSLYRCRMVELGVSQLPGKAQFCDPLSKRFVTLPTLLESLSHPLFLFQNTELYVLQNTFLHAGSREIGDPHPKNYISEMWEGGEQLRFIHIVLGFCFLLSDGIIMLEGKRDFG